MKSFTQKALSSKKTKAVWKIIFRNPQRIILILISWTLALPVQLNVLLPYPITKMIHWNLIEPLPPHSSGAFDVHQSEHLRSLRRFDQISAKLIKLVQYMWLHHWSTVIPCWLENSTNLSHPWNYYISEWGRLSTYIFSASSFEGLRTVDFPPDHPIHRRKPYFVFLGISLLQMPIHYNCSASNSW